MRLFGWVQQTGLGIGIVVGMIAMLLLQSPVAQAATADGGFNLTISPLPISLKATPGQTVTTPLSVQNTGTQPVKLKVSLMKFKANGTTGEPLIQDPEPGDTYLRWVTFSKTSFIAEPGVINNVTMTIRVPNDAGFGYYYAAMFSQDDGGVAQATDKNKVQGAVASLVLLEVNAPGLRRELQVTSFTSENKIYQYLPATFTITVKNTGNTHAVPQGNIFIGRNESGDFIGTLPINENQGNVLPGSSRTFTVTWDDGFPNYAIKRQNGQIISNNRGQPVKELTWDLTSANKFRLGKYTASMTLIYDNGTADVPISSMVTFWVIPWIPLLVVLLLVALIGFGVFAVIRSIQKRVTRTKRTTKDNKEKGDEAV